jgi:polyphosphate kinase
MFARAVAPQDVPPNAPLDHPSLYFNRELSWLDFNWRVLHQACDEELPLLEKVRFIAITCSNLDEFFQKRVGGLRRQEVAGITTRSVDGRLASEQLGLIREAARVMQASMTAIWEHELRSSLAEATGIEISAYADLDEAQRSELDQYFVEHVYPVLTPLAVDPGHPFPFISNLSLSLGISLRHRTHGSQHFARVKVPAEQGRWLRVASSDRPFLFVAVEDVVRANVHRLFPGMEIVSVNAFRVTRNADIRRDDEDTEDLLAMISEELRERRFAPVVRLEVEEAMSAEMRDILVSELELDPRDVYGVEGHLGLVDCMQLASLPVPEHRFPDWEPVVPVEFRPDTHGGVDRSVFDILRDGDVLVHHPYDSFGCTVQRLVEEAADDPRVVSIKQTLYRTSENSPIVAALMRAAGRGKQVAVLVEVTARFDEARNIEWAQALEEAGVHVTYGVMGLKTHCKVVLVVRMEDGVPRTYGHIGTGNYHVATARLYTDIGLLTANREIGSDLVNLFHFLTGHAPDQQYSKLVVAPRDMRTRFVELIRREVAHHQAGRPARILWKMNALDDYGTIRELYAASAAGVRIDLIIRGHSRLRPGIPGISDNIRVRSIIGRFLEHDRAYCFVNGGDPEVLIGSADCRERNLERRVEAMVPILDRALRDRIVDILELALQDNQLAAELQADGTYLVIKPREGEPLIDFQEELMRRASRRADGARRTELNAV